MPKVIEGNIQATGLKLGIVVSRFNELITGKLLEGAMDAIVRSGGDEKAVTIVKVPGSFEIPLAAMKLAATKKYDGVICLGAIIKGGTPHYEYIATELAKGINHVTLEYGCPVAFGVITADDLEQAIERAGTKHGNKGRDAALAVIEMANVVKQL